MGARVCVGPVVPTQTVGSKFLRYSSEFTSASMHLLALTLHVYAILGLVRDELINDYGLSSQLLCGPCRVMRIMPCITSPALMKIASILLPTMPMNPSQARGVYRAHNGLSATPRVSP
jgi:hypothetical protein